MAATMDKTRTRSALTMPRRTTGVHRHVCAVVIIHFEVSTTIKLDLQTISVMAIKHTFKLFKCCLLITFSSSFKITHSNTGVVRTLHKGDGGSVTKPAAERRRQDGTEWRRQINNTCHSQAYRATSLVQYHLGRGGLVVS